MTGVAAGGKAAIPELLKVLPFIHLERRYAECGPAGQPELAARALHAYGWLFMRGESATTEAVLAAGVSVFEMISIDYRTLPVPGEITGSDRQARSSAG